MITSADVTDGQTSEIARRGATLVEVAQTSELGRWLGDAGARAAIIRPDRTVMISGRSVGDVYTYLPTFASPA